MEDKDWPSEYKRVPTEELSDETQKVPASYGYGMRHVQSGLLLFCITISYLIRAHLGVSVVAMARQNDKHNTTITFINSNRTIANVNGTDMTFNETQDVNGVQDRWLEHNGTIVNLVVDNKTVENVWNVYRTYELPKAKQEMILGAFFYGYSLSTFPMGMVVQRFGGKITLQIGLLMNGLLSIVTPTVAVWGGWKAVCVCRFLQGLTQSGLYPSVHTILAKWIPIQERATFVGYVYTGTHLGTILAFQISGLLASSGAGWPSTFWVMGVNCLLAFALITVFTVATPADHKTISVEEKNYIMGSDSGSKVKPNIPWKKILSSNNVWASIISHVCCGVCHVFLFTQTPTYIHQILGFNIKNSGLLSSLPYIGSFFCAIVFGVLSDYCITRNIASLRTTRIVSNTLGQVAPAACLIAISYTDNITLAVTLIVAAVSLYTGVLTGWTVTYIDMTRNFSGSLMTIGNTGASAGVLFLPVLVSNIVTDVTDRSQWRIVMFIMAGIIFFGNLYYVCFMSTDKQPWDETDDEKDTDTEAKPGRK